MAKIVYQHIEKYFLSLGMLNITTTTYVITVILKNISKISIFRSKLFDVVYNNFSDNILLATSVMYKYFK